MNGLSEMRSIRSNGSMVEVEDSNDRGCNQDSLSRKRIAVAPIDNQQANAVDHRGKQERRSK